VTESTRSSNKGRREYRCSALLYYVVVSLEVKCDLMTNFSR